MTVEILEKFQIANDYFGNLVAGVSPDRFAAPAPSCPEWSVQELIGHVVKGDLMFTRLFTGAEPPAVPDDDPVAAISASAKALLEAASAEGALEKTYTTPMGERAGAQLMTIRVVELSVHGWDLAHATGQRLELPEAIVETSFGMLRRMLAENRDKLPYGPEQPAGPDASPTERLVAYAGRAIA